MVDEEELDELERRAEARAERNLRENPLDANGDGHISLEEFGSWAKMVAREYLWLYVTLILGYISFYKPVTIADWQSIGLLALLAASTIYGGLLKKNFQNIFQSQERKKRALEAEILAHKEALSRSAAEVERLKNELEWLKGQREE